MADEILIPPYETLAQMLERNTRERAGIQALLRMRAREPEEQSNREIRIPVSNRDARALLARKEG
jgi:hypothetical protein